MNEVILVPPQTDWSERAEYEAPRLSRVENRTDD